MRRFSVAECVDVIVRRLETDGRLRFTDLFTDGASRRRLVATFLALLELVKAQAIRACQEEEFGEILLVPGRAGAPAIDVTEEDGDGR